MLFVRDVDVDEIVRNNDIFNENLVVYFQKDDVNSIDTILKKLPCHLRKQICDADFVDASVCFLQFLED